MEEIQIWHDWERGVSTFCINRCLTSYEKSAPTSTHHHEVSISTESDEGDMADMALMHMWESRCLALETELQIVSKSKDLMLKQLTDLRSGKNREEDRSWRLEDAVSELQSLLVLEKETNSQLHERMRWTEEELFLMREREKKVLSMKGRNGNRQLTYTNKKKMDAEVLV